MKESTRERELSSALATIGKRWFEAEEKVISLRKEVLAMRIELQLLKKANAVARGDYKEMSQIVRNTKLQSLVDESGASSLELPLSQEDKNRLLESPEVTKKALINLYVLDYFLSGYEEERVKDYTELERNIFINLYTIIEIMEIFHRYRGGVYINEEDNSRALLTSLFFQRYNDELVESLMNVVRIPDNLIDFTSCMHLQFLKIDDYNIDSYLLRTAGLILGFKKEYLKGPRNCFDLVEQTFIMITDYVKNGKNIYNKKLFRNIKGVNSLENEGDLYKLDLHPVRYVPEEDGTLREVESDRDYIELCGRSSCIVLLTPVKTRLVENYSTEFKKYKFDLLLEDYQEGVKSVKRHKFEEFVTDNYSGYRCEADSSELTEEARSTSRSSSVGSVVGSNYR